MPNTYLNFFEVQRQIYGLCSQCQQFFRLSDCSLTQKTKCKSDWLDELQRYERRVEGAEERLWSRELKIREQARSVGRTEANRLIRKVDRIFKPRRYEVEDAKPIFHPLDFVLFKGMSKALPKQIILLDQKNKNSGHKKIQTSIRRSIDKGAFDWVTVRVTEDGRVSCE